VDAININSFNDFNPQSIGRRTLSDDPVLRIMALSISAGQGLPQHAADGLVTIFTISGKLTLWENETPVEMTAGTMVRMVPGAQHRLQAHEDSRLIVNLIRPSDPAVWNSLAPNGQELDLRWTPHSRRHSTIFYAFDQLQVGQSFFLVNDHDPVPLRMQIEQARPGEMAWEYETRGPELFRIRISRVTGAAAQAS
jgi:uncharacterized protein (DUF2249 family)/quercetin dioxygenase-like cupin family protein